MLLLCKIVILYLHHPFQFPELVQFWLNKTFLCARTHIVQLALDTYGVILKLNDIEASFRVTEWKMRPSDNR